MSNEEDLRSLVLESGLSLIGEPLTDPDVDGGSIVFVRATEIEPTSAPKIINKLSRKLAAKGELVKIIAPNQGGEQIEAFLTASIKAHLPDVELDLTIAWGQSNAGIWINLSSPIPGDLKVKIETVIHRFLAELGIKSYIVKFKSEKNHPSPTACLRVLRRHAPCNAEALTRFLQLPSFDTMSLAEVRRFLDTARRKGQVIRRGDGRYILTLQCLMELGSSRDRFSPDVSRALALRRLGT
ncbi:hypothetical protein GFK91_10740 [Roseibium aggregatum]|uniref:hypothetical protein n=1 Tax=Roseibium aggregatum TaxID=187304 RepID=UPI001E4A3B44|nr:hypothetical protein [Roseibium aggregatum]UES56042.1 hypothetical protein GFK91_10740 [Roseibium aggregatum]